MFTLLDNDVYYRSSKQEHATCNIQQWPDYDLDKKCQSGKEQTRYTIPNTYIHLIHIPQSKNSQFDKSKKGMTVHPMPYAFLFDSTSKFELGYYGLKACIAF